MGGQAIVTKLEIQAIIDEAVSRQVPISHVYAPMQAGSFYTFVRKYKLKIPKYKVKFVCQECGKEFLLNRISAGGQTSRHIICPKCKPGYVKEYQRKYREKERAAIKAGEKIKGPRKAPRKFPGGEKYRTTADGWTYNPQYTKKYNRVCQGPCGRKRRQLNRFGFCKSCFQSANNTDMDCLYYAIG